MVVLPRRGAHQAQVFPFIGRSVGVDEGPVRNSFAAVFLGDIMEIDRMRQPWDPDSFGSGGRGGRAL